MMKSILRGTMLAMGIGMFVGMPVLTSPALAAHPHVGEALEHAKGAASHGKEGHADACVEHAGEALKHASAADAKNPHVAEGVKHLKEAVMHGKAGHADACTEHANGAVTHLGEVK